MDDLSGIREVDGSCEFCKRWGPLTGEHLGSDWLNRAFPEWTIGSHEIGWSGGRNTVWKSEPKPGVFTFKVVAVCEPCNNGWMSRLESAVIPTLTPMARGEGNVTLSRPAQRRLAFWIAKTAMVFTMTEAPMVPTEHYAFLYRRRSRKDRDLPSDVRVLISACPNPQYIFKIQLRPPEKPASLAQPYAIAMNVGNLLMQITFDPGKTLTHLNDRFDPRSLIQIWPIVHDEVKWPPQPPLDRLNYDAFIGVFLPETQTTG